MNVFDREVLLWLNGFVGRFEPFDDAMRLLASDYLIPPVVALVLFATWFAGKDAVTREFYQRKVLIGAAAVGLSNAVIAGLNAAWHRPRPFIPMGDDLTLLFYPPTDPSFPANPTAVGFAVVAALWKVSPRLRVALIVLSVLIGFSRMYGGVFYLTDIVAGAAVGVLVAYGTGWLFRLFDPTVNLFIRFCRALALA